MWNHGQKPFPEVRSEHVRENIFRMFLYSKTYLCHGEYRVRGGRRSTETLSAQEESPVLGNEQGPGRLECSCVVIELVAHYCG